MKYRKVTSRDWSIGKCPITNKLQYEDEATASKQAKQFRKRVGTKIKPYLCKYCDKYHNGHYRPPEQREHAKWN